MRHGWIEIAICAVLFSSFSVFAQESETSVKSSASGSESVKPANPFAEKILSGISEKNGSVKPVQERKAVSAEARPYLDAIQAYYDRAKTYSASFEQDYETVDGIKKTSKGTVWFKKPGLMRWDYETPESRFLISDGTNLWTWEVAYRQYCKMNLKDSQLPTALSFLTGTGRIEDEFNVSLKKADGNQVTLELSPIYPSMAYERIQFEILMPTAKVYRAVIYDAMGNLNRITFKSPEINSTLDDASFKFVPPSDARQLCE